MQELNSLKLENHFLVKENTSLKNDVAYLKHTLATERDSKLKLFTQLDALQKTLNHKNWRAKITSVHEGVNPGVGRYEAGCRCSECRTIYRKHKKQAQNGKRKQAF